MFDEKGGLHEKWERIFSTLSLNFPPVYPSELWEAKAVLKRPGLEWGIPASAPNPC